MRHVLHNIDCPCTNYMGHQMVKVDEGSMVAQLVSDSGEKVVELPCDKKLAEGLLQRWVVHQCRSESMGVTVLDAGGHSGIVAFEEDEGGDTEEAERGETPADFCDQVFKTLDARGLKEDFGRWARSQPQVQEAFGLASSAH